MSWRLSSKMMLTEAHYRILQPLIYTSRIFGLCPMVFKKQGNYYEIRYSLILIIYSYIVIFMCAIGICYGVKKDIEAEKDSIRMKNKGIRVITLCDMAMVFLISLYGVMSIPYKMNTFLRMINIWSCIDKIAPMHDYRKYRNRSIKFLTAVIAIMSALIIYDNLYYHLKYSNLTSYLKNYFTYYMLYFILISQEIFVWHMVFFIYIRIATLNEYLRKEKFGFINNLKQTAFTMDHFSKTIINVKQNSNKKIAAFTQIKHEKSTAERIQNLVNVHRKIRQTVNILNGSASYGSVLLILSCLLHLVVTPYFLLVEIFGNNPSLPFIFLQHSWFLGHIGRLFIMIEPCHNCLNEYEITNSLVSELALLNFDKQTKSIIKTFMFQVSSSAISFDTCGFFKMDRTLLTSIAGAVTTYLVILFQFNINDN